jgi:hypothetical protein
VSNLDPTVEVARKGAKLHFRYRRYSKGMAPSRSEKRTRLFAKSAKIGTRMPEQLCELFGDRVIGGEHQILNGD